MNFFKKLLNYHKAEKKIQEEKNAIRQQTQAVTRQYQKIQDIINTSITIKIARVTGNKI